MRSATHVDSHLPPSCWPPRPNCALAALRCFGHGTVMVRSWLGARGWRPTPRALVLRAYLLHLGRARERVRGRVKGRGRGSGRGRVRVRVRVRVEQGWGWGQGQGSILHLHRGGRLQVARHEQHLVGVRARVRKG